ncbi:hypothetical protein ABVK25_007122 [Lepraria finkii]|uniref:Uncharacterized protein n=1 Tax=Lepraria finkii TaxID=1340010 RepID=A0ABR4B5F3_9LECA
MSGVLEKSATNHDITLRFLGPHFAFLIPGPQRGSRRGLGRSKQLPSPFDGVTKMVSVEHAGYQATQYLPPLHLYHLPEHVKQRPSSQIINGQSSSITSSMLWNYLV